MAKVQIKSEKLAFFEYFRLWDICNALLAQIIDFSLGLSVKWADRNIDAATPICSEIYYHGAIPSA